jgi:hypothetical protein
MDLIQYLHDSFGLNVEFAKWVTSQNPTINTWKDFVNEYSKCLELDDPDMNVAKSSSWGICQEMLGKLKNKNDIYYIQSRGGIWKMTEDDYQVITLREVIADLKKRFPIN